MLSSSVMAARRTFVPRGTDRRKPAAGWLLAAALAPSPEIVLRARSFEPGEIVRVDVSSAACKLGAPQATFLDQSVTFVRGGDVWSGWIVIPLDRKEGSVPLSVSTACEDGSGKASTDQPVAVAPKEFPEQKLTVESKYVNPSKAALARIEKEKKRLSAAYARRTPIPASEAAFVMPVSGESTSVFGARRILNGEPRSPHPGIDLRAGTGTPVVAAGGGVVALAGDLYYSGGTVIVDHGAGLFTIYAHLSKIEVKEGATVEAGQRVGLSGATGRVTGPHLHWGARVGAEVFDPRGLTDPKLFGP
jgi:peptidase M23-like protein